MNLVPRKNLFDMDSFFDDFWSPSLRESASPSFFAPRVDIKDLDDHYEITAELPGVKKEDIHVHVEDGVLTLEAETNQEDKEEKEGKIIRQERHYGKFMRSFNVGNNIHEEDIFAKFEDGVLKLQAPKVKEQPPKQRKIEIS